ncbi:expansin EXLX1 family cellulose-binding protein [Streptomyces sp. NBC_00878]|uniref:expansin EXLX1 family cellulose-binding protein n=1 Tax=Streptomyces sp. NBC_00878 TaxID=2975854 RepID=UPI002251FBFE|nr:expansin EXLX1 family cellulose-binding protein [Streptomyces sp. NBC_00878]MCX4910964.1 expansin EXLX1 family cellulose-binding protein [Streptomyces sp. NBC_00878]
MHRRWLFIAAASALIVVSLVVGFLLDHEADSGPAEAAPVGGTQAGVPPATGPSPTTSLSATDGTATPSAKGTPRRESARATTAPAKSSAADTPQSGSAAAPLAGRIRPGVTYRGVATFYDSDGTGACLYDASGDVMTAAMNHTDYESAKACGAYVRVRAANGASITVRITNECPGECAPGHIDLSAQAFAKLAPPSLGEIPITWTLLSPSAADTISVRYKSGSSRYWCGVQVIGHRNPVARLEVRAGSGWRQLPRTDYNYFISDGGSGCGGEIRITDIFGEQLTVTGIALTPDAVQSTRVQFAKR